jgi:hypothetical protein
MKYCLFVLLFLMALPLQAAPIDTLQVFDLTAQPVASKTVTGAEAKKILSALDALPWDATHGKKCFFPGYRLEGRAGKTTVLDASICFACEWVQFIQPKEKGRRAFDSEAVPAQEFQKMLKAIFAKP